MTAEEKREYNLAWYHRQMAFAREILGGKCVKCGSTDELQFDHVDPTTKLKNVSQLVWEGRERFLAELEKCQLLCKPCHEKKSTAEQTGIREHGSLVTHRRGKCTCQKCRDAYNAYRREWRARTGRTVKPRRR